MSGNTVRERRELRGGAQRPADDRNHRSRALLSDHGTDNFAAVLAAAGEHHGERVDESKPRPFNRKRRQRTQIEADDEVRDGVAENPCRGARLPVGRGLHFALLCEGLLPQQCQGASRGEKQPAIDRAFVV